MHRLQELVRLHRQGSEAREIARLLGISPNTERRYRRALAEAGLLAGDAGALPELEVLKAAMAAQLGQRPRAPQSVSRLEAWRGEIETMVGRGAGPRAIYDALRLRAEFAGSVSAVKRVCRQLRRARGVDPKDVAIPVVTAAGEVAQVDFGYAGRFYDPLAGVLRRAWVFVMVLGHSRLLFCDVVFDQKVETFIDLHVKAFHFFGGVPQVVVPDNLKAAVVRAAFTPDDELALQRSYRELARHYSFKVDPTPPYAPQKKGKVESGVKYVKRNFFAPRASTDVGETRSALRTWLSDVANARTHGTTRRVPREVFDAEEKAALTPLPERPFEMATWKRAKVYQDSHIIFDKRLYSVPWTLIGQDVWVRATPSTVVVYAQDERVATHDRRGDTARSTKAEHLPEHRRDYRERQRSYWEERAEELGDDVRAYVRAIFEADDALLQLRTVQAIVKHLESFPQSRAQAAARRALHFGTFKYGGLKAILQKALDLEPLPEPTPPAPPTPQTAFRFARRAGDFNPHTEPSPTLDPDGESHEYH